MEKTNFFRTSDQAVLYYEDYGKGIPIVFVSGFAGTTKCFERNVLELSKKYRTITFDLRGYGRSSKALTRNNIMGHAEDIKELIEYLDLHQVILLGWSSGGSAVTCYCKEYGTSRLCAVGLIDCPLFPFSEGSWNAHRAGGYQVDNWWKTTYQWITEPEKFIDHYIHTINPQATEEERNWIKAGVESLPPWIGIAVHSDYCQFDGTEGLPEIQVPVLIFSSNSPGFDVSMSEYYQSLLRVPSRLFVYENATHMLFYVESGRFNKDVDLFIQDIIGGNYGDQSF